MTERVVEFGPDSSLVGILNQPRKDAAANSGTTVILLNSGTLHRVGPCRLYVRIARRLAECGIGSLRFDFSGIGDSPPRADGKPFHEYSINEVGDAIEYLIKTGAGNNFVLLGMCSGADTAWYSAVADERVKGIVLLDGFAHRNAAFYWNHYKCRIFNLSVWKQFVKKPGQAFGFLLGSQEPADDLIKTDEVVFDRDWPDRNTYAAGLDKLVARHTYLYYLFTGGAIDYFNHSQQLENTYEMLRNNSHVAVEYYPEANHMISDTNIQPRVIQSITQWVSKI